MRKTLSVAVCLGLLPVGFCAADAGESTDSAQIEESLVRLNETILESYVLHNDTAPLERATAEGFLVVTPAGIESREQVIATVGNLEVESVVIENERIEVFGSAAVLAGTIRAEGTIMGRPMPNLTYLSVYAKEGDGWRLVARSLTPKMRPPGVE